MIKPVSSVRTVFFVAIFLILFFPFKFIQLIGITCIFIIGISYLWAKQLESKIKVYREEKEIKSVSFEKMTLSYSVVNQSRFKAFMCYSIDNVPYLHVFEKKNERLFSLRSFEKKSFFYEVNALSRGLYEAGPIRIDTSDPLGLFNVRIEQECKLKILIRPARLALQTKPVPGLPQGAIKINNPVYEDITMRRTIREYKSGDELKRINWRLSAKFNRLYTNEFEDTFDAPFFVFLNLSKEDYSNDYDKGEKAIEIAASIVNTAASLKQSCGFACYGSGFPYIKPRDNQTEIILDMLSLIKMEDGSPDYDPVQKFKYELSSGTLLFVIGPKEVDLYKDKVAAKHFDMTTATLGIMKEIKK